MRESGEQAKPTRDSRLLQRKRLTGLLLDESIRLFVLSAPGGYGKSVLLAGWVEAVGATWISLKTTQLEPKQIASRILAATGKGIGTSSQIPSLAPDQLAEWVVQELVENHSSKSLAIDEVQIAYQDQSALLFLNSLVHASAEAGFRLGLSGRDRRPLSSIAKLSLTYGFLELGALELAFTDTELSEMTQKHLASQLSDQFLKEFAARTAGWPALVMLALRWLAARPEQIESGLSELSGSESSIYAFLASQILEEMPELHRQFLLMASLVEDVPSGLAEHLLPGAGIAIMKELQQSRFVTSSSQERATTYSFHPLLREFLEDKAREELGPQTIRRLKESSANWFAGQGLWNDAFAIWHEIGSDARIVDQMRVWEEDFHEWWGDYGKWMLIVPNELLDESVRLLLRHAMNSANVGHPADAMSWLKRAESRASTDSERLDVECVRAVVLFFGNFPEESLALSRSLVPGLPNMTSYQKSTLTTAMVLLHNNEFVEPRVSLQYLEIFDETIRQAGYVRGRYIGAANRAVASRIVGNFDHQIGVIAKIETELGHPVPIYFRSFLQFSEAQALLELGSEDGPIQMRKAMASLKLIGAEGQIQFSENILAMHLAEQGGAELEATIPEAASSNPYVEEALTYGYLARAWQAAHRGDKAEAQLNIQAAQNAAVNTYLVAVSYVEGSRVHLYLQDRELATSDARKALEIANDRQFDAVRFRSQIVLCVAEPGQNDEFLTEILRTAQNPWCADLLLKRERRLAGELLLQAAHCGVEPSLAFELLNALESPPVRVQFFGQFKVWIGAKEVKSEDWQRPQAKALFAFLLLQTRPVHAEQIIDTFWPDSDPKSGRANLKTAVMRVRKALGSDSVITHENDLYRISFSEPVWQDRGVVCELAKVIRAFEESNAAKTIQLCERALQLAHGAILEEYRFEDWAIIERERLEGVITEVLFALCRANLMQGEYENALTRSEQILSIISHSESAALLKIEALVKLGRRDAAQSFKNRFVTRLTEELGAHPSAKFADASENLLAS